MRWAHLIELEQFAGFLMALVRFSTFIIVLPIFNFRGIPTQAKIGLACFMAILATPSVSFSIFDNLYLLLFLILQEVAIGLVMGFFVVLVFSMVYFAGQLIDVPMGFGMATVFDPSAGMQLPIFSQFYHLLAIMVFFAIDGHIWLLRAASKSFESIPVGYFFDTDLTFELVMALASNIFSIGLRIALPVMGTIFLTDLALGIVIRAVPQINVFVIGFPIKIVVGMVVIIFALPFFISLAASLFGMNGLLFTFFSNLLKAAGGT